MSKLLKKSIISFLLFLTLFTSIAPNFLYVRAQATQSTGTWYNSSYFDWFSKVYDQEKSPASEIFGERYTAAQVQWVVYGLISIPLGLITSIAPEVATCVTTLTSLTPVTTIANSPAIIACGTGIVSFATNIMTTLGISSLYSEAKDPNANLASVVFDTSDRQISGIKYVKDLSSRLSPVTTVHAQGYGYTQLDSIKTFWAGFRNMAYAIVVLVTIVFAFMIMFKVKLNPQTVISVQSALPKIIGAVILATFSYAIAGFLIDLSYVVAGIFASLLKMAGFASSTTGAYSGIIPSYSAVFGSFTIFWFMLAYTVMFALAVLLSIITIVIKGILIFTLFGSITSILFIALWLWVFILMFVYTIKIPWVLIKNLISIYISIIVGPLQIVMGTLVPSIGFGTWLKKLISELLVFPVTGLFMYMAWIMLLHSFEVNLPWIGGEWRVTNIPGGILWSPNIIGGTSSMAGLIWLAASFTLIALLPKVVDIMKAMIMGEKFSFGNAMGEAYGPLKGAWDTTGGSIWNSYRQGAARLGVIDAQDRISGWIERHPWVESRLSPRVKRTINAPPGEE